MIVTYYSHSKNILNLKDMELKKIGNNSKYFLKIQNFKIPFTTFKWNLMCMTYKTKF
jgi:hypothetical protein